MSMTVLESFQRILECNAFIESIEAKFFHERESIDYADRKLGTKLNGGILLSANDGSYKRHVEADDTIRDTVFFLLIHLKLLPVKLLNNEQVSVLTAIEKRQRTLLYLLCYDSKVAANI